MAGGFCKECTFDESWTDTFRAMVCQYANCAADVAQGQPFLLDAIVGLATPPSPTPAKRGYPLG